MLATSVVGSLKVRQVPVGYLVVGVDCEIVEQQDDGNYLARLTLT